MFSRLACAFSVCMLTSCGSVLYMSPMPSVPLLEEKGDVRVDAKLELPTTLLPFAIDADAGYAVSEHVGVTASGQYVSNDFNYFQAGAGYHTRMKGKQILESYVTAGKGLQVNRPDNSGSGGQLADKEYTRFDYGQYCIQVNYGLANLTKANIDLGLSLRGGLMAYRLYGTTDEIEKVNMRRNVPIAEPMAFFRIGSKPVKFQIEVAYSTFSKYVENNNVPRIINSPVSATCGLSFNF